MSALISSAAIRGASSAGTIGNMANLLDPIVTKEALAFQRQRAALQAEHVTLLAFEPVSAQDSRSRQPRPDIRPRPRRRERPHANFEQCVERKARHPNGTLKTRNAAMSRRDCF